jgi:hypothetical protein
MVQKNCAYSVFQASEKIFKTIFPGDQDIEFIEDLIARIGKKEATKVLEPL